MENVEPQEGELVTERAEVGHADDDSPLLVLLHGVGSNERDLLGLLPLLAPRGSTEFRVLSYRAPHPFGSGFSWFPISRPGLPEPSGVEAGADLLAENLALELGADETAVLLGFSQGVAVATTVLRRHPQFVKAVVCLSGFTLAEPQPADPELLADRAQGRGVPAFLGFDLDDPAIPADALTRTSGFLKEHTNLTEHRYPGAGHGLVASEIADIATFLAGLRT